MEVGAGDSLPERGRHDRPRRRPTPARPVGRTPEFFTARAAPTSDVILLGLLLGLVIPLTAGAVVLAAHHFSPAVGRVVHASVIVVSGALLTLAVLAHTPAAEWPAGSVLVAAFVAGAGLAFAFRKSASTARCCATQP